MKKHRKSVVMAGFVVSLLGQIAAQQPKADLDMVARIREEGLQRSRVMDTLSYMTDVLGARLTLSEEATKLEFTALLMRQTTDYLHSGRHRVAL